MSQLRRRSLDSKLNLRNNRIEAESESIGDNKSLDKTSSSAKRLRTTDATTGATRQTSIKEQLKPKASTGKNNKRNREDNSSSQKSPPKKRANCETTSMPVETTIESNEVRVKELKPEHEELKQQIFAGIKLMLDPIKEDIEQIKLDQCGYESKAENLTGHKIQQQIIKNEVKQKKLETRTSALEDQLLEKNIIFQGLPEDEFEDQQETKMKIISVLTNVTEGATAEDRKEAAKKTPIDSIERMGKYKPNRTRLVKVKFTNKTDVSCLFKNLKKLPDGVFIDREYSKATEKERRVLRPIVKAARKIEEYKGKCWLEGPYLKLDGKCYHRQNVHTLPEKLGPAEVTSVSDDNSVAFFGELNPFSNFHPCQFSLEGLDFHSTEQYIQMKKAEFFRDDVAKERILHCEDALDSKMISKDILSFNKREWSKVAEELYLPGIRAKFFQNPGLMASLLNTGTKNLVESSYDDLWGTGIQLSDPSALDEDKWKTVGLLGKMLMSIRSEKLDIISGNVIASTEESVSTIGD